MMRLVTLLFLSVVACTGPTDPASPATDTDTDADSDVPRDTAPPERGDGWVWLEGGTFLMGSPEPPPVYNEVPQHAVTVPGFWIQRHEAQSTDYAECVDAGVCPPVPGESYCHRVARAGLPQNCLTWDAAAQLCWYLGGRIPSESEWEFAASSRGTETEYPWGTEPPDCSRANVWQSEDQTSCGGGMWRSCEHPAGDTPLGLCDMGGNAFEWTADWYHENYDLHPTDGSPQLVMANPFTVMRGGGIGSTEPVRVRSRTFHPADFYYGGMGVRCVAD